MILDSAVLNRSGESTEKWVFQIINQLDMHSLFAFVGKNINSRMNHDQRRQ